MKHAGQAALDRLEPVLAALRALPQLREKSRGTFYVKSRAALHFHEDPAGDFADFRAPGAADFERLKVTTPAEVEALIARVRRALVGG